MASITVRPIESKPEWEDFVASRPEANFLHSWNWGEFHKNLGKNIHRLGFLMKGDAFQGVILAIVEPAKRGKYLTVPGGPLIDWNDTEVVRLFVDSLRHLALSNRCSFVRVRPQIFDTEENRQLFQNLGFKSAPMHLHAELTHQLDLSKSEPELLANMRKATRYEINRAKKLDIIIKASQNPDDIASFYELQLETARRQQFIPFSKQFLAEQFRVFATENQAVLYSAYFEQQLLAQAFIIFYGAEADYHYGASTAEGRKYPGAYAIQWAAIKEAKARGIPRYNFWGVAPEGETNHRFHGVSVFKRGFHGEDVAYLHAHDLVIDPLRYALNWSVETLRKKIRKV